MFIDYMEQLLGEAKWNTAETEANFNCPFCSDNRGRFRMNSSKLIGFCFNCDWKGNAVSFVRDHQHLSLSESFDVVNFYQEFKPLPADIYEEIFDQLYLENIDIDKKYIEKPADFKMLSNSSSLQAKKYLKYAKSRSLTDLQIERHQVGFCPEGFVDLGGGKTKYLKNYLITQVFGFDNEPLYWNGRAILDTIKPKAYNPVGGVNTINKSDVIFNLNHARKTGFAIITEGVFDSTTVGDSGVCLFGKTLSVKQLIQLINAELEAVYIMLDPDAANAAVKMAATTSKHIPTFLCDLKKGDPNQVGKRGCLKAIKGAEAFDRFTAVKYKLLH